MATSKPTGQFDSSVFTLGYRDKETLPTRLEIKEVVQLATALPRTTLTPEQLLNRILVEGRGDAGTNEYNTNNKRAVARFESAKAGGHPDLAAKFLAAVLDKTEVAKRTGKSFDEAWNGVGRSKVSGKTGADYAARVEQMKGAATDPRNEGILQLIRRAAEQKLAPEEKLRLEDQESILGKVFGDTQSTRTNLMNQNRSPLAKAVNKKFETVTGKSAAENDLNWEQTAQDSLLAYIRKEAGTPLSSYDQNVLDWHKNSPEKQQVFTELARESLPALGIKKDPSP